MRVFEDITLQLSGGTLSADLRCCPHSKRVGAPLYFFFQKTHYSDNVVMKTLSTLKNNTFVKVGSEYDIGSCEITAEMAVKKTIAVPLHSVLI